MSKASTTGQGPGEGSHSGRSSRGGAVRAGGTSPGSGGVDGGETPGAGSERALSFESGSVISLPPGEKVFCPKYFAEQSYGPGQAWNVRKKILHFYDISSAGE